MDCRYSNRRWLCSQVMAKGIASGYPLSAVATYVVTLMLAR